MHAVTASMYHKLLRRASTEQAEAMSTPLAPLVIEMSPYLRGHLGQHSACHERSELGHQVLSKGKSTRETAGCVMAVPH